MHNMVRYDKCMNRIGKVINYSLQDVYSCQEVVFLTEIVAVYRGKIVLQVFKGLVSSSASSPFGMLC